MGDQNQEKSNPIPRRAFLKSTGLGVSVSSVGNVSAQPVEPVSYSPVQDHQIQDRTIIPPHRSLDTPGVHAYPIDHSIAAGDRLELCVSSSVPYKMGIYRLGQEVDEPGSDMLLGTIESHNATPQPIHPGSYIHVSNASLGQLSGISLSCWVRTWRVSETQGLITKADSSTVDGFALTTGPDGSIAFYLGDGRSGSAELTHRTQPGVVKHQKWHHIVATWDGSSKSIYVDGLKVAGWPFSGEFLSGNQPIRIGAMGKNGLANHFLDADIAQPCLYNRALTQNEIEKQFENRGLKSPVAINDIIAFWPLTEERGDYISDSSVNKMHGRLINHGTWMIGGPSFHANTPRFGQIYKPDADSTRGHGLRLASDDLYDCRWNVTHQWQVPVDAKPGLYVARMEFEFDEKPRTYHCTFVVRKPNAKPKAPILLVYATNTWRAYSGTPFAMTPETREQVWGTGGIGGSAPGLPAYCFYRGHAAGQGTYQLGLRMPWPAAGPYVLYGGPTKYSHLARADRFTQAWLEKERFAFDTASDLDFHRDPEILSGYQTVLVVGHNEYWSRQMYDKMELYLSQGGRLAVLSGNSLGWRVSFNDDNTIMECRKVDCPGNQMLPERRGEAYHSHDKLRGGASRECGIPGVKLIGLDIIGWNNQSNPKNFGPYVVDDDRHFLFQKPEATGLKSGEKFGWAGEGLMPMANGHEMDIRPSTFLAMQQEPTPDGASIPNDGVGITRIANGIMPWKEGGKPMDYFFRQILPKTDQGAEMIYWERSDGGIVFNAGSIASGWLLHYDPKWATLFRNVLAKFGVTRSS